MELIKKVSQKEICKIAKKLNAKRIGNCCYQYEGTIYDTYKLIMTLDLEVLENYEGFLVKEELFYSCGLYGNNGQLHKITYAGKDKKDHIIYVYYTNINYNKDHDYKK